MGATTGYPAPQYGQVQSSQIGSPLDPQGGAQQSFDTSSLSGPASMKGGGTASAPNYQQMASFAGGQPGRFPQFSNMAVNPAMQQQAMQQQRIAAQAQALQAQPAMPQAAPPPSPQQQQRAAMYKSMQAPMQQRAQAFQQRSAAGNPLQQQTMRAQALRR